MMGSYFDQSERSLIGLELIHLKISLELNKSHSNKLPFIFEIVLELI